MGHVLCCDVYVMCCVCRRQDCQINQLQLNSSEVAAQLTLRDFHLFHDVEPTEYVDELFELHSKYGHPHLDAFSQVSSSVDVWE